MGDRKQPNVLDACSGMRMMWFDRKNNDVVFGDRLSETLVVTDRSHGNNDGKRILRIVPDIRFDFRSLPFPDGSFRLVVFDPPHLVRAGRKGWLFAKYGVLGENWRDDLRQGFSECFRVLCDFGVMIFKWNEIQIGVQEILSLVPVQPLFGNKSGKRSNTHWIVFMKPNQG